MFKNHHISLLKIGLNVPSSPISCHKSNNIRSPQSILHPAVSFYESSVSVHSTCMPAPQSFHPLPAALFPPSILPPAVETSVLPKTPGKGTYPETPYTVSPGILSLPAIPERPLVLASPLAPSVPPPIPINTAERRAGIAAPSPLAHHQALVVPPPIPNA